MGKGKRQAKRSDGWGNLLTGLGSKARDKRFGATLNSFSVERIDDEDAEALWRGDPLGARVVELPPAMMLRNGVKVSIAELEAREARPPYVQLATDALEDLNDKREAEDRTGSILEELEALPLFIQAGQYERAYGGAALLLGADDGQGDLSKPLKVATLRAVRYLLLLRPRELWPRRWNNDPTSKAFGQPTVYEMQREAGSGVSTVTQQVHASRLILFPGRVTSRRMLSERRGWGDSVFVRLFDVLRDYNGSHDAIPALLQDFAQAVHKIKGLAELLAQGEDDLVRKRLEAVELGRSILRAAAIDADDDLQRQQTPVAGLAEMVDRTAKRFSGSAGIPPSLLFGEAPAGLNATGEVNERWYADELLGERELRYRPRFNRLVQLILQSLEGPTGGKEPERWSLRFGPLSQPTPGEVSKQRLEVAQADSLYLTAQVVTPEEVASSRFGDEWSGETRLDHEARAMMAEAGQPAAGEFEDPNADPELEPDADPELDPELEPDDEPDVEPEEPADDEEPAKE